MISATLVQASQSAVTGTKIFTVELIYPRFIHAEVMTHREFSRNGGSSRAIPVNTAVQLAAKETCYPAEYRYNKSGMQPAEEMSKEDMLLAQKVWRETSEACVAGAMKLEVLKLHKQWANRMLEWFSPMKLVVTTTDWANFFWLRDDEDAQIEIRELARKLKRVVENATPVILQPGEWHVPYIERRQIPLMGMFYYSEGRRVPLEVAQMISQSCTAQVSYRRNDTSYDKAVSLRAMFLESGKLHASPFEHQATPIQAATVPFDPTTWEKGITHVRRDGTLCSGNLRNFIQYRQLLDNHVAVEAA